MVMATISTTTAPMAIAMPTAARNAFGLSSLFVMKHLREEIANALLQLLSPDIGTDLPHGVEREHG
jgi:hypothetical protein